MPDLLKLDLPVFSAAFAPDDAVMVQAMLARNDFSPALRTAIRQRATRFVDIIRAAPASGGLEEFMQEYSLSTKEGLALMVLAEALLRVPDASTQNELIEEKLGQGDWQDEDGSQESWLLMLASFGIRTSNWLLKDGETPAAVVKALVKRLGLPVIRTGVRQAMQFLGHHFVLGQTIEAGLRRARKQEQRGFRYSYDMLGEGARTSADAKRYFAAYAEAIETIGKAAQARGGVLPDRPGISVKLSAIHPRYEMRHYDRVMQELVPSLLRLAQQAKAYDLNFTVDAEEADRLELSLDVFQAVAADSSLAGWDGFGLAIQAYQKRAMEVIEWVNALAQRLERKFMVRLVKGAYWDSELKRAQERGLEGFPVFTKKAVTDLCYADCARALLEMRPRLFPQFATHNALTLATIIELAKSSEMGLQGFEFQRLHGMGEALYEAELDGAGVAARIYAPVGGYKDLLAYLVRRLLENSANSSFVAQVGDENVSLETLLELPQDVLTRLLAKGEAPVHAHVKLPKDIFPNRKNSAGREPGVRQEMVRIMAAMGADIPYTDIGSLVAGKECRSGASHPLVNPAGAAGLSGVWWEAGEEDVKNAFAAGREAFAAWDGLGGKARADILRQIGDQLEAQHDRFLGLLAREAGKTFDDAISEVREAVDFCRYYANEAERLFAMGGDLPGPVGERNRLGFGGRGVFVCISPWNFPLAIFTGQVVAALVTGNCVIAKPAEQTPLIAYEMVRLMHRVGVPEKACQLLLGGGMVGKNLCAHNQVAGVVFTGSTATAQTINRALAAKDGPIVPLIAETGGINAMIVDSTALPEQVADDVVASAFKSAGQRCSALRLLYLQEDVAEAMLEMIIGAAGELVVGDPADISTDVGPVIDAAARERLQAHVAAMVEAGGDIVFRADVPETGTFMAPHIIALRDGAPLRREPFGPILHVVRWRADRLDEVIEEINEKGFGLTFGLHSRLEGMCDYVAPRLHAGNIYVNRNMIGAVVGAQPFGGMGLSGTGPKAGGPLYLTRFVEEKTISINTAAAGGNASLIAMED